METAEGGGACERVGAKAVWAKVARQYEELPLRVLRVEAEVFGVSRAGPKASLIERLILFNAEYVEADEGGRCLEHAGRETALPGRPGFCGHPRRTRLCVARVAWRWAAKCTNYGPPLVVDDARSSAKNHSCHGRLHAG